MFFLLCGSGYSNFPPVILVIGDSLSSAHGLAIDQGWVSLLQQRLQQNGYPYQVVNASVSGDTTANGLTRLPTVLDNHQPQIVIVELGGNDGLRAQPVALIRDNLNVMVETIREYGARVILAGMRLPPNYGPAYVESFGQIYPELAQQHDAVLVPFFMDGVATAAHLMQSDGIHPSSEAQPVLLDNVWSHLEPILESP